MEERRLADKKSLRKWRGGMLESAQRLIPVSTIFSLYLSLGFLYFAVSLPHLPMSVCTSLPLLQKFLFPSSRFLLLNSVDLLPNRIHLHLFLPPFC